MHVFAANNDCGLIVNDVKVIISCLKLFSEFIMFFVAFFRFKFNKINLFPNVICNVTLVIFIEIRFSNLVFRKIVIQTNT